MTIKNKITELFKATKELTVSEIVSKLGASKQMVHIAMNQLVAANLVEKFGKAPKTIYRFISKDKKEIKYRTSVQITKEQEVFLQKNFLLVTETGKLIDGVEAFDYWCEKRNLPTEKTIREFIDTKKKYAQFYDKSNNVNGFDKLKNTKGYEKIWLHDLYYLDFYAIERFGKTRLGTLLHYAKQGQNKYLMKIMLDEIKERIINLLKQVKADAIGFVPPTIRREVQLMKFIQSNLNIPLPVIEIKKISGIIPVPQKSLSKLDERIKNAENTFAITESCSFNHVVLIDDAVGSGSTLNQIAEKIVSKKCAKKVTGLAIVGSFKGFDVITDI